MSWLTDGPPSLLEEWEKSSFHSSWGGGNWKDRWRARDGIKITLPTPNIPPPGEHSLLPKLSEKLDEGLTALTSPGSGIHRLGTNLEASWKAVYSALEYPEKAFKEAKGWRAYGRGSSSGSSGSPTDDGAGNGDDPTKPNEYTYNINVGGLDLTEMESERERADRMRRMLAGRYGRGETNLTGGTGFGTGSQRTLGGYS